MLNLDEVPMSSRRGQAVAGKLVVPASRAAKGAGAISATLADQQHVTVLLGGSAAGLATRPLIILPVKNVPEDMVELAIVNRVTIVGSSNGTGGMTRDLLREHLPCIVRDYRIEAQIGEDEGLLVIMDGHSSRYNAELLDVLKELKVDVVLGPAHACVALVATY